MTDLTGTTVAVLGGDKRELEIVRSYLAAGSTVITFGVIRSDEYETLRATSLEDAVARADVMVGPMPGVGVDNSLFAPHADEPIRIDESTLAVAKPGSIFFCGRSTDVMRAAGALHGVEFHDIGDDDFVQVQHAIPTAEAAISIAVRETDETVNGARCLVVGYGRIGQVLASYLRGWGSAVTVAARRPEVRARAGAAGHGTLETTADALQEGLSEADLVFVTAPARLLDRDVLEHVPASSLVIDLASPPGGLDHAAADEMGVRHIWARAQADSAWRHSGRAQYDHMIAVLASRREGVADASE